MAVFEPVSSCTLVDTLMIRPYTVQLPVAALMRDERNSQFEANAGLSSVFRFRKRGHGPGHRSWKECNPARQVALKGALATRSADRGPAKMVFKIAAALIVMLVQ